MAMFAAMMAQDAPPAERSRAMSAAKVQISRSARLIGQEAIQLHGGIGMTMEYKVGHYFKRLTMIDIMFGDAEYHLATSCPGRRAARRQPLFLTWTRSRRCRGRNKLTAL